MSKLGEYVMCYFDDPGEHFCVDVHKFGKWQSAVIVPVGEMDGMSFQALGKMFTVQATMEEFMAMPTVIRLPSEAYD